MNVISPSVHELGYLKLLVNEMLRRDVLTTIAAHRFDALVYATFDHQPIVTPADATTRTVLDSAGPDNTRRLSPVLGFPALTVPAGFTADGMPVGLEFMGREFSEPLPIRLAHADEQETLHRQPPGTTPALSESGSDR
jgi:Asp-tRNA(Asn)/Glu-tRNA(Gln) amidotransferase A subunit family amidase